MLYITATLHLVEVYERVPKRVLRQDARVSNYNTSEPCTGQRHVETARVGEEPDTLVLVGPDHNRDEKITEGTLKLIAPSYNIHTYTHSCSASFIVLLATIVDEIIAILSDAAFFGILKT